MSKIGKLWTDSVAYLALILGAGLSIAGNVADTYRVRGVHVDTLDIVLAVAWPALVVLMVEVFVSSRWQGLSWPMQWLRWAGCLAIGAMAMRVSWVHLNDLLLSRGQARDVSILGPLAIDALAIMATALILAGRGQLDTSRDMANVPWQYRPTEPMSQDTPLDMTPPAKSVWDMERDRLDMSRTFQDDGHGHEAMDCPDMPSVADEARTWLDSLQGAVLDTTTTAAHPVSPAPAGAALRPESVPHEAAVLILAWDAADKAERPPAGQADALLAAYMDRKNPRTARRWREALGAH